MDYFLDDRFDPIKTFNKKYKNNEVLLFSTPVDPPFTYECIRKDLESFNIGNSKNETCVKGMNFELFEFFAKLTGIKWKLVPTDMNAYKVINSTAGQLGGLLGMLQRGEIHGGATLLYLEEEDEISVADFTFPVGITYGGFVYLTPKYRKLSEQTIFGVFLTFTWQVWISVIFSLTIILIGFWVCKKVEQTLFQNLYTRDILLFRLLFNLTALVSGTVLIYSYQSKMTSEFLLNPKIVYPFTNFNELAKVLTDKSYRMVTHSYSRSFLYTVNSSDEDDMIAIRKSFDINPLILAKNRDDAVAMVASNPKLMYFTSSKLTYDLSSTNYCNLTYIEDPLPRYLVFAFRKHSGLADLFNRFMYASGFSASDLKTTLELRYLKNKKCIPLTDSQMVNNERPLTIQNLYGALVFISFGYFFSFVVFTLELMKLAILNLIIMPDRRIFNS